MYAAEVGGGTREIPEMRPLTMLIAAGAVTLAGASAVHAQSTEATFPSITGTATLPRLPNVFHDCWKPLPRYCVRPPGLLWFGNATTLRHERRFRHVRTAVSR
jgi:hypothetical protein